MADYVQATDPGAVGAGKTWLEVNPVSYVGTQDFWCRNGNNSGWTKLGNLLQADGGNFPVAGGATTGPITGSHGLAPTVSPNFTSSLKRDGFDVARMADLNQMRNDVLAATNARINELVTRAIASPVKFNVGAYKQVVSVVNGQVLTIPATFTYPDGSTSKAGEILLYGASWLKIDWTDRGSAGAASIAQVELVESPAMTYTVTMRHADAIDAGASGQVLLWAIATR